MIAIVTILVALPLGFFVRSRLAANTTYAIAYLWAFVFQTLYLTLESMDEGSSGTAFAPQAFPLSYGVVALAIFVAGFGLVATGCWLRGRRDRLSNRRDQLSHTAATG